ncbi:Sec-independent protein translocase subunit TatA [Hydrogenovibrio marinus]|uniref:Sec-independent protein translocase protein TatA n=1 Tax=Hydrogenovibrio marinus TaxID=28885 RepID=A0A067A110_HYDMR|nr:Sec-independent protein translocase subunit TatA [Hydrogenovibrio marinus]KDN96296.1 preprotein translocase subunit TatA [Hydrogenovibrio marinus]BBN60520.1 Sec-independent protein translocase protein TatA [Hydrogenovibrio marinus]
MGISIWQLLIILAIVLVLFGAKRLRNVGTDLGNAIKGFKNAVKEEEENKDATATTEQKLEKKEGENVFDVKAEEKKEKPDA